MGIISKFANLYDKKGNLLEKTPISNKFFTPAPVSKKYPGVSFNNKLMNSFRNEQN